MSDPAKQGDALPTPLCSPFDERTSHLVGPHFFSFSSSPVNNMFKFTYNKCEVKLGHLIVQWLKKLLFCKSPALPTQWGAFFGRQTK